MIERAIQTILVIDPTPDLREVVLVAVEVCRFHVHWSIEESKAIDFLRQQGVAAIVVNIDSRPAIKFALMELVRKQRRHFNAHIIAISEKRESSLLAQALSAGADDYMSRPVLPHELATRFKWAVSMSRLDRSKSLTRVRGA